MRKLPKPGGPIQGTLDEQNAAYAKLSQASVPLRPGRAAADTYYRHEEGAAVLQKRAMGLDV